VRAGRINWKQHQLALFPVITEESPQPAHPVPRNVRYTMAISCRQKERREGKDSGRGEEMEVGVDEVVREPATAVEEAVVASAQDISSDSDGRGEGVTFGVIVLAIFVDVHLVFVLAFTARKGQVNHYDQQG